MLRCLSLNALPTCSVYVHYHRITPFWMAWEAVIISLMWAALGVFIAYAFLLDREAPRLSLRVDAYDALPSTPARYFMTKRANGEVSVPALPELLYAFNTSTASAVCNTSSTAGTSSGIGGSSSSSTACSLAALAQAAAKDEAQLAALSALKIAPEPGEAQRWQLPEERDGLNEAAEVLGLLQKLFTLYVVYYLLQGFILLAIIMRWLNYICFQPRLNVISGTLGRAMPVSTCWSNWHLLMPIDTHDFMGIGICGHFSVCTAYSPPLPLHTCLPLCLVSTVSLPAESPSLHCDVAKMA